MRMILLCFRYGRGLRGIIRGIVRRLAGGGGSVGGGGVVGGAGRRSGNLGCLWQRINN